MSRIVIVATNDRVEISPTNSGFAHGYGLFETIRVREGKLCFWQAHWERLAQSAVTLGFQFELSMPEVLEAISQLRDSSGLQDGLVKLSLLKEGRRAVLYVYGRDLVSAPQEARLRLEVRYPQNERSLLAGHKTHNYMEHMALFEKARTNGFYDCLRLNTLGQLTETCIGNIFFIRGKLLCTPALDCGILPGVVRGAVLDVLTHSIFPDPLQVECGHFSPNDLSEADAVFMTNASAGVLPVSAIDMGEHLLEFPSAEHPEVLMLQDAVHTLETKTSI